MNLLQIPTLRPLNLASHLFARDSGNYLVDDLTT